MLVNDESGYFYIQFVHAQQQAFDRIYRIQQDSQKHLANPEKSHKSCLLKRGAADALEICAIRIQVARARREIVREQNETLGTECAGDVDLLDRRLRRYAIRADACPNLALRVVGRRRRDFDLFLKDGGVG